MQKSVTRLPYRYVDHADRKVHGFVYVSAKLEDIRHIEPIQEKLDAGDGFIPADLGLGIAELHTQPPTFPSESDKAFHAFDFDQRTYTRHAPVGEKVIDVDEFMNAFGKIPDSGFWDVTGAITRLGLDRIA